MRKLSSLLGVLVVLIAFAGCPTTNGNVEDPETGTIPDTGQPSDDEAILARMADFLDQAAGELRQGAVSDAIQHYVDILAAYESLNAPNDEALRLRNAADTELLRIGAGLRLDPASEWVASDLSQRIGVSSDIGNPGFLQPRITLTLTYGTGRALVPGVLVVFEFASGGGVLGSSSAVTDDYGAAECRILSFDDIRAEQTVRARIVFGSGSFEYSFEEATRNFSYAPPSNNAVLWIMERSELGDTANSGIVPDLQASFSFLDWNLVPYDGQISTESFLAAFAGDPEAIRGMADATQASYLVLVASECYRVRQVELNGRTFNLFTAEGRGEFRILRVRDGSLVYSATVDTEQAQAGDRAQANRIALEGVSEAIFDRIGDDSRQIQEALER